MGFKRSYLHTAASISIIVATFATFVLGIKYKTKISKLLYQNSYYTEKKFTGDKEDAKWAKKIMNGGYLLHFRHAERDKWIDVQMYDALESDVHDKGINKSRNAENDYFGQAVCLNSRGKVQAKAIGEHLSRIELPIGYVISSPSCRARQTSDLAFGGSDELDRDLVHNGPYTEKLNIRTNKLKNLYLSIPIKDGTNSIVSAHNGVVIPQMFDNEKDVPKGLSLEEGGFYVISRNDGKLKLEHEFHNYNDFNKHFYLR